jgi:hypothetical protein
MGWLDATMATAAGVAVFALIVSGVASVLSGVAPNPVQIAIPLGIGFGMAAMTGTYIGLAADPRSHVYRAAFASGAFGVTSLGVGVVAVGIGSTLGLVLVAGAGAGAFAAVGVLVALR